MIRKACINSPGRFQRRAHIFFVKNKFLCISDLTYILFPYILDTYKCMLNNKHIEWLLFTKPAIEQLNPEISEKKFSINTPYEVTEV